MTKKFTFIAFLTFLVFSQSATSQDYIGSWALDWSQALANDDEKISSVADTLKSANMNSKKNPIWILATDSLKIYQNGSLISTAQIEWTRTNRFEIIDENRNKKHVYYINDLDDGKIKMSTGYSDAEIYLRRL